MAARFEQGSGIRPRFGGRVILGMNWVGQAPSGLTRDAVFSVDQGDDHGIWSDGERAKSSE